VPPHGLEPAEQARHELGVMAARATMQASDRSRTSGHTK